MHGICYIAGRFRDADPKQMAAHVLTAQAAVTFLARFGWASYCPHANLGHAFGHISEAAAKSINDLFLDRCDAIYLLPGWGDSIGARYELQRAKERGLIVFRSADEVRAWAA